jgi:hypothetical protein
VAFACVLPFADDEDGVLVEEGKRPVMASLSRPAAAQREGAWCEWSEPREHASMGTEAEAWFALAIIGMATCGLTWRATSREHESCGRCEMYRRLPPELAPDRAISQAPG